MPQWHTVSPYLLNRIRQYGHMQLFFYSEDDIWVFGTSMPVSLVVGFGVSHVMKADGIALVMHDEVLGTLEISENVCEVDSYFIYLDTQDLCITVIEASVCDWVKEGF